MKRHLLIGVLIAVVVGLSLGAFALWAAFDHNPQGEFFDRETGQVVWSSVTPVFASWFALGTVAAAILYGLAAGVAAALTRKS